MTDRPLIVTAELDEATHAWLDGLRRAHFPPERNHLQAHLTLFHALPGTERTRIESDLEARTSAAGGAIDGVADRWILLGRGVAAHVDAPRLKELRSELAQRWDELLTPQDAGGFGRPHVTVQNKVAPDDAKRLHAQLGRDFRPRPLTVEALALWHYDGGPWEAARRFPLTAR